MQHECVGAQEMCILDNVSKTHMKKQKLKMLNN